MYFIILVIICFVLGLILSKIDDKTNQISSEITELKKEMHSCYRGVEMDFRGIEYKIDELKEMVGKNNA
jgi:hypothetical protein